MTENSELARCRGKTLPLRAAFTSMACADDLPEDACLRQGARRSRHQIGQSGNTQNDGVRGIFRRGAQRRLPHPHLRRRARNRKMPARARTLFCCSAESLKRDRPSPGVQPAMVTDRKSEEFPILVAPSGRNGETEGTCGGFLGDLRPPRCRRMQASRSKHNR